VKYFVVHPYVWHLTGGRITFSEQGECELYGNNVELRKSYLPTSANRSWILVDNPLPEGCIKGFYIYVHNVTQLDLQSQYIWLQVWQSVNVTLRTYRLRWLQQIKVSANYNAGALYWVSGRSSSTLNTEYNKLN